MQVRKSSNCSKDKLVRLFYQFQVENHLHDMILKTFDPKKADAIFAEEGETPSWLAELIEYPTWRSLIYRLAEDYPGKLIHSLRFRFFGPF